MTDQFYSFQTSQETSVLQHRQFESSVTQGITQEISYDSTHLVERKLQIRDASEGKENQDIDGDLSSYPSSLQVRDLISKVSSLESELVKERASSSALRRENARFKQSESISPSTDDNSQTVISQLRQELRKKGDDIRTLSDKLFAASAEVVECAGGRSINLASMTSQIGVLEVRLQSIQTENKRLNSLVAQQQSVIQGMNIKENSASQQLLFQMEMHRQIEEHMNKAEQLLEENEQLSSMNDRLTKQNQVLDGSYRQLQLKQSHSAEEIRVFWKDHFAKIQESMQARFDSERREMQAQIDRKNDQNAKLQAQLQLQAVVHVEKQHLQEQIETSKVISKNRDTQLKDYQSTIERHRQESISKEKQILDCETKVASLSRKIIELEDQIVEQSHQLQRLAKIESDALGVIKENQRLQEIAERKSTETVTALKFAETSKKEKEGISQMLRKHFDEQLAQVEQVHQSEKELWVYKESQVNYELSNTAVEMKLLLTEIAQLKSTISRQSEDIKLLRAVEILKIQGDDDLEETNQLVRSLEEQLSKFIEQNSALNENLEHRLEEAEMYKLHITNIHQEAQAKIHQLKEQAEKVEKSKQLELHQVRTEFEAKLEELSNQTKELASEMVKIETAKAQSEQQMKQEFKQKIDVEIAKGIILAEQVRLLQDVVAQLEKQNEDIQESTAEITEKNAILLRTNDKSSQIIDIQEAEVRRFRLAEAAAEQKAQTAYYSLNQIRKDYDDLKQAHQQLLINSCSKVTLLPPVWYSNEQNIAEGRLYPPIIHEEETLRIAPGYYQPSPIYETRNLIHSEVEMNLHRGGPPSVQLFQTKNPHDNYEAVALHQAVEQLRVENKSILLTKVHDYNSYQENLRHMQTQPLVNDAPPSYRQQTIPLKNRNVIDPSSTVLNPLFKKNNAPSHLHATTVSQTRAYKENRLESGYQQYNSPQQKDSESNSSNSSSNEEGKLKQKHELIERDLEYFRFREVNNNQLLESLQFENEKLTLKFNELEKKYQISERDEELARNRDARDQADDINNDQQRNEADTSSEQDEGVEM